MDDADPQSLGDERVTERHTLPVQRYVPAIRCKRSRQYAGQSTLTVAVFSHQGMYFAGRELEASGIECNCRAKVLGNVVGCQEGMHKRSQQYYIDTGGGNHVPTWRPFSS